MILDVVSYHARVTLRETHHLNEFKLRTLLKRFIQRIDARPEALDEFGDMKKKTSIKGCERHAVQPRVMRCSRRIYLYGRARRTQQ